MIVWLLYKKRRSPHIMRGRLLAPPVRTMPMILNEEIGKIALDVARSQFGDRNVRGVDVDVVYDSWDDEVIRLTMRLEEGTIDRVPDDAVLDTLVEIRSRLEAAGEQRRPTINYDEPEADELEEPEAIGGPRP